MSRSISSSLPGRDADWPNQPPPNPGQRASHDPNHRRDCPGRCGNRGAVRPSLGPGWSKRQQGRHGSRTALRCRSFRLAGSRERTAGDTGWQPDDNVGRADHRQPGASNPNRKSGSRTSTARRARSKSRCTAKSPATRQATGRGAREAPGLEETPKRHQTLSQRHRFRLTSGPSYNLVARSQLSAEARYDQRRDRLRTRAVHVRTR
jgi:hypothetical protein